MKKLLSLLITLTTLSFFAFVNPQSAYAFAGTLENGNLAYAQSSFNTGEACNYLPGYETGYDAWHFVLTTRGATFQQDSKNPAVSVNLNFVFMRQDGTTFPIKSGAWVQTGKGAYVYSLVTDRLRMVQSGSLAVINGVDSGMRLSHTCPGTGTALPMATPTPTPTPTASPSPTPTVSPTPTPSPTPTASTSSTSPYKGTLENGDNALADSSFNTGEACVYLPGYETGYDAWHYVLTTRGAVFHQSASNPKIAVDLHMTFKRPDGSTFTITSGAWVQTGKGAYVYTLTSERDRQVMSQTYAALNVSNSGMRLSHTCPGAGTASPMATPTPTPTPTPTASPTPSASPSPSPSVTAPQPLPTPTPCKCTATLVTPKKSPTPTPSPSSSASPSASPSPTPSPTSSIPAPTLPTPPPVKDPENLEFLDPKEPVELIPPTENRDPNTPVEVVIEPKYGDLKVNDDGSITYTSNGGNPLAPKVDTVELRYTNLSGEVVIVRKEFIVKQEGDVPSVIQTGSLGGNSNGGQALLWISALSAASAMLLRIRFRRSS